jgi:hypothetical protein
LASVAGLDTEIPAQQQAANVGSNILTRSSMQENLSADNFISSKNK